MSALRILVIAALYLVPIQAAAAADELDPFAPAGISIGMKGTDAAAKLEAAGYEIRGDRLVIKAGDESRVVEFYTGPSLASSWDGAISFIKYRQVSSTRTLSGPEIVSQLNERIGAEPGCDYLKDDSARCAWHSPPNAPLVLAVELIFRQEPGGTLVNLTLHSVPDLEAHLASPTAGSPPEQFDPFLMGAGAIGAAFSEAEAELAAKGFTRPVPADCVFTADDQYRRTVELTTPGSGCDPAKPVAMVQYEHKEFRSERPLTALVEAMNGAFGVKSDCQKLEPGDARCQWYSPPAAPLVNMVSLTAWRGYILVEVMAIGDIETRVTVPQPPAE